MLATTVIGVLVIVVLINGHRTSDYPEVVHLRSAHCAGVVVRPDLLITAQHCGVGANQAFYDGDSNPVGETLELMGYCEKGLEVWSAASATSAPLPAIKPDTSRLADAAPVRLVGFGVPFVGWKMYADGTAVDATCPGCSNIRRWTAKLASKLAACTGDSGGGGYTIAAGSAHKLTGIIEGSPTSGWCSTTVTMHRLDQTAWDWIEKVAADFTSAHRVQTACPVDMDAKGKTVAASVY